MHTPFYPCKNITDRKVIVWDLSEIQKEESVEDGEYSKGAKFVHCGHTMGVNDISFNLNDKGVMCSVGQDNVLQEINPLGAIQYACSVHDLLRLSEPATIFGVI